MLKQSEKKSLGSHTSFIQLWFTHDKWENTLCKRIRQIHCHWNKLAAECAYISNICPFTYIMQLQRDLLIFTAVYVIREWMWILFFGINGKTNDELISCVNYRQNQLFSQDLAVWRLKFSQNQNTMFFFYSVNT